MFIGHFAAGFAAKRVTPGISLAVLFGAAQLADMVWPMLLAFGYEEVAIRPNDNPLLRLEFVRYPYSHSLALLAVWGAVLGVAYGALRLNRRAAMLIAALVVSHWFLDALVHRPDVPVYPGGPRVGLGLWNSVPATLIVEGALYTAGVWMYATATRSRDRVGRWAFWSLATFLLIGYLGSMTGPPPPSVRAVYGSAIVLFGVILLWSWWADKHRA